MIRIHSIIISVLMFFCLSVTGQTLDDAKSWYLEGRYAEALPVFRAEYPNNPNNPSINQWLGVSLYETGRIAEAQKYLEFASTKKIPEAYVYLGELYVKMYRFADAEKEFEKYQRIKRKDQEALAALDEKRAYAEKLQKAVNRTEDLQVIDSLVVPKSDFLSAYNLSAASGSLIPVNEFFRDRVNGNANDRVNGNAAVRAKSDATGQSKDHPAQTLFMNERRDKVYYSGGDAATGTSLFTMDKLLDTFGNEKRLPETVNKGGNQAFPFVLSDGLTLYFASTDDSSFGGYDLFVTRYNLASDTYLNPNQLNMPFNSPFNDYMIAIDEEKGIGWFASDRFQPADSVCVYIFIPNQQVQLIETEEEGYLAGRARIASIADTWKEGTDYRPLRLLAQQKAVLQKESAGDFTFVINNQATYHTLADFKSGQARSLFTQALGNEKKLQELNEALSQKRDQFAGRQTNTTLAASILDLEKESESLFRETEKLKVQARNEEIRTQFN